MKTKNIFKSVLIATGVFLWTGCSDFLDEKSQDEVIPKTAKDFGELLMGSAYPTRAGFDPGVVVSWLDDDITFDLENANTIGGQEAEGNFAVYTWQPDLYRRGEGTAVSVTPYYLWFERIKGCNAVLDNIDAAIGTQAERDQVKAEALAIRAYHYFMLVNLYGEPYNENKSAWGVPLKLSSTILESGVPRNTVEEVYDRIVKDLTASAELFEKYNVVIGGYRINLLAVKILLSRVYLYMERWQDAVDAADAAIMSGGALVNLTTQEEGKICYMNRYEVPEVVWVFGGSVAFSSTAYKLSEDFVKIFSSGDCRKGHYIYPSYSGGGEFRGWILSKNQGAGEPGQHLRVSEAYLNRMEANAHVTGGASGALADLNTLRRHRVKNYNDVNITDVAMLLDTIRVERRKELCIEGHRWFDLRRYGMPELSRVYKASVSSPVLKYTLKEKDPMYTLPLPASVVEKNKTLIQNVSDGEPERTGVTVQ